MKNAIVLVGEFSSGKSYAGDYLSKKLSIIHLGISSSIRTVCNQRKIPQTRENLALVGRELTILESDYYLAKVLLDNIEDENIIISGCRQLGQLEYLKRETNCILVGILTDPKIRYKRMCERGKKDENMSYEEFLQVQELENSEAQNVGRCLKLCDIFIENNGSIEEFKEKLSNIEFL
ncbi:AAA family ATPase [Candidatus Gracilibacteria bacterium]|nr:AAA family ATPase [Candidatus Gracilibacteria bacterium]